MVFFFRRRHKDRPDSVPSGPDGGSGSGSCRSAAGDLHGAGDLLLPPQTAAGGPHRGRQEGCQGERGIMGIVVLPLTDEQN